MVFNNDSDVRQDRDDYLVHGFADRAGLLLRDYREWILSEIKECMLRAEALEATAADEKFKSDLKAAICRMSDIEQYELPDAIKNIRKKCTEIEDGAYDNVMDAHQWIQDGLTRFEAIVRSLLSIRKLIDSHWLEES